MHVFGVVVWVGGLMFQNAVVQPVVGFEPEEAASTFRKVNKRFMAFIWMSVWTIFVTGVILMLLSPRFLWFQYREQWAILLGCKQIIFIIMVVYAFGYARMLVYLEKPSSNGGVNKKVELYRQRLHQFRKINIFLGIIGLLLAAAM